MRDVLEWNTCLKNSVHVHYLHNGHLKVQMIMMPRALRSLSVLPVVFLNPGSTFNYILRINDP